ncbi:Glutamate transport membrane-spanning protein [Lactobacillus sp. wkB8]|nr:Glutamate transport membrane-spanning protein [Lactobacillus sp. wkB8]
MINIFSKFSTQLFIGLGWTVLSSVIALFFSLIIGTIFAIMEVVPSKVMRVIGHAYVEIMRNIPLLVITMFFYLVIPMYVVKINGFTAGTIGLTLSLPLLLQKQFVQVFNLFLAAKWRVRGQLA